MAQERFILSQPRIWWDMYHDRPTFSYVNWSDEDMDEYRAGLETEEGVHAVSQFFPLHTHRLSTPSETQLFRHEAARGELGHKLILDGGRLPSSSHYRPRA
jgi:NADH:ubiquinone oxidoreductase subunit D